MFRFTGAILKVDQLCVQGTVRSGYGQLSSGGSLFCNKAGICLIVEHHKVASR